MLLSQTITLRIRLLSPCGPRSTYQSAQHQSQQRLQRREAFNVPSISNTRLFALSKLPFEDGSSARKKVIAHFRVLTEALKKPRYTVRALCPNIVATNKLHPNSPVFSTLIIFSQHTHLYSFSAPSLQENHDKTCVSLCLCHFASCCRRAGAVSIHEPRAGVLEMVAL